MASNGFYRELFKGSMAWIAMISLLFGFAGTDVVTQLSLSRGMSPYVLVVYRLAFSTFSCALFALILERYTYIKIYSKLMVLGIFSSVIANYVQDLVIKYKGQEEFASAFIPLRMVIVVVMGPFILPQKIYLSGILGVVLIVPGLYSVLWGSYTESHQ